MTQQTMNANDADFSGESQRELAEGVLKQAAQDLRRFHGAASTVERELYIRPQWHHREHLAVPRTPKLVGRWQRGIETMSGPAQWKLHLTFAHSPSPALATVNHRKQP